MSRASLASVLGASFISILVFVFFYTLSPERHTEDDILAYARDPSTQQIALPSRIKIPRINVDTSIESVGVTFDGKMDVPSGPTTVAWFNQGPKPGEIGSAVIDGHSGWRDGTPTVFDSLTLLTNGDVILVEDSTGATVTFIVRETKLYDPQAATTDVFLSSDGKSHLNLITCDGIWDPVTKKSSLRLVIFADRQA